jgi:hypothetical protein
VDHDRWGHSKFSSSLANVKFPRKVVLVVVDDNHGKRGLEFDWHHVARKIWVAGWGSGKNHGQDQHTDSACDETSSVDSQNRT